jgi:hypothetical protein
MMSVPLTEHPGAEKLTSCVEDSLAKTYHQQEKVQESKDQEAVCGSTWRESSVKFDLNTLSWKTHQCLWEEDLAPSLLTLPKWGMMQSGECWELEMSEQITNEIESGLLVKTSKKKFPTPTCHNSKEAAYPAEYRRRTLSLATYAGGKLNPMWVEWLMGWSIGWTDLKPLVTDKSHYVQQWHGKFSQNNQ